MTQVFYDVRECRDPAHREADLMAALSSQVAHAQASSPAQAQRLAGIDAKAITSRAALATLPVLRKGELLEAQQAQRGVEPFAGFSASGWRGLKTPRRARRVFQSPGPLYEPQGEDLDFFRMARAMTGGYSKESEKPRGNFVGDPAQNGTADAKLFTIDPALQWRQWDDKNDEFWAHQYWVGENPPTDAVINLTTGGAPTMTVQERFQPALQLAPEVASLNMGSMNFGLYPMQERWKGQFKHAWEPEFLERTRDTVFKNTFADIEYALARGTDNGTRFEFECYDTAHLYNLAHFLDRKLATPPLFVQTVFGILGGIGSHPDDVAHMKRTADRLFGKDFVWSVLGAGRAQMNVAATSAAQGGHVRVGLEDSLWDGPGQLARSNADQVRRVRGLLEGLGLAVATPAEARDMLRLKGRDAVGF